MVFGIPSVIMILALIIFVLGTSTYRFYVMEKNSPFARLGSIFIFLAKTSLKNCTERFKAGEDDGENQNDKYASQAFAYAFHLISITI